MAPEIEQFLLLLPVYKREIALQVRDIFLSNPAITEAIKWRNFTLSCGKTNVAFIYTFPQVDYINLGFMQATSLQDTKNLFEGTGKGMRHIKLKSVKDIPPTQLKKWVNEAVLLATI